MIAAIVPAAGLSQRMGQPKLLLEFEGAPLIRRVVLALRDGGVNRVVVVVPAAHVPESPKLAAQATEAGAEVIIPANQPAEMRVSVELALARLATEQPPVRVLLAPADAPGIRSDLVRLLSTHAATAGNHIVIPTFHAKRGHPVVFPWEIAATLPALEPGLGLNKLVARNSNRVIEIPVTDPSAVLDLDTPLDLEQWMKRLPENASANGLPKHPSRQTKVGVRLFARAKEQVGQSQVEIEIDLPTTVGHLRKRLGERWPELRGLWAGSMIAVNEEYAADNVPIEPTSRLAIIPPVSGGSERGQPR